MCGREDGIILTFLERSTSTLGPLWMVWKAHEKCAGTDAPIASKPAAQLKRRTVWRSKNRSK